jgi:murein DD-endopeptidase MepM/ murein hydrolase activator NlpD
VPRGGVRPRGHSLLYQFKSIEAETAAPKPVRAFGSKAPRPARRFDLVTDLGHGIGSARWLRGAAACAGLCTAAWWLAPGFEPIPAASASALSDRQLKEARAFGIAPLALGADTGRRMVATAAVISLANSPERPRIDLIATIGVGDGFTRALERAGVASAEAGRVAALVNGVVPLANLKPGTAISLTLGARPNRTMARPLEALSLRAGLDLKLSLARAGNGLVLNRTTITVDSTPLRIQGQIGSSLYHAARAAGAPSKAVEAYIRTVAAQDGLAALSPGDRFDIIVEHRRAATGEAENGALLYAGLDRADGKDLQLMPWTANGATQWFEASGVGKQTGMLQRPVPGAVSSSFGMRFHPILGYFRMHKGVDFHAAFGTPIMAVTDGRVAMAGWAGGYGNQVRLAHGGGLMSSYSHMSRIAAQPGAFVRQGQVIGYVGSTGLSTGPHLHYELFRGGVPIDPATVRFVTRSQLDGPALAAFRQRLNSLLALPVGAAPRKPR